MLKSLLNSNIQALLPADASLNSEQHVFSFACHEHSDSK